MVTVVAPVEGVNRAISVFAPVEGVVTVVAPVEGPIFVVAPVDGMITEVAPVEGVMTVVAPVEGVITFHEDVMTSLDTCPEGYLGWPPYYIRPPSYLNGICKKSNV